MERQEPNDWMVVYRQGRARTLKVAVEFLTWQEAHDIATEIVAVNAYLPERDRFTAYYVHETTREVKDDSRLKRFTDKNWNALPTLRIVRI